MDTKTVLTASLPSELGVPVCLASEIAVLGACIESDAIFAECMEGGLGEGYFFLDDNRKVFRAIVALSEAGTPVDVITVAEKLGGKQDDYVIVADLVQGVVVVPAHIVHHVELLKRLAYLRNFLEFSQWMQTAACTHGADPDDLERQARINLDRLRGQL